MVTDHQLEDETGAIVVLGGILWYDGPSFLKNSCHCTFSIVKKLNAFTFKLKFVITEHVLEKKRRTHMKKKTTPSY